MSSKDDKFDTRAISAGRMSDAHFGAVNTPIYRASTILYPSLEALEANDQPYTYGRRGTPTTRSFEDAISALEGAHRTVSVTSGVQAIGLAIRIRACTCDSWSRCTSTTAMSPTPGRTSTTHRWGTRRASNPATTCRI